MPPNCETIHDNCETNEVVVSKTLANNDRAIYVGIKCSTFERRAMLWIQIEQPIDVWNALRIASWEQEKDPSFQGGSSFEFESIPLRYLSFFSMVIAQGLTRFAPHCVEFACRSFPPQRECDIFTY